MSEIDLSGIAEISDEGIKKHFKNIEPCAAIFELAWNGLDANASIVDIGIRDNKMDFIDSVYVHDNGDGIDFENMKDNFGKFNDSHKKEDAGQHGSHGRGRLAFHRTCHEATWHTKSLKGHAKIKIEGTNIKHYSAKKIDAQYQHNALRDCTKGTFIELSNFHENLPALDKLHEYFSTEFGWYLALNPDRIIRINGNNVTVPGHEIHEEKVTIDTVIFNVKIIRWFEKPSSEKSFTYLLNGAGNTVHKQLSSFNQKANFFTSIYIQSSWADDFSVEGVNLFTAPTHTTDSDEWKKLIRSVNDFAQRVYEDFLRQFVDAEIEKYVTDGIFPEYKGVEAGQAAYRLINTKIIVKSIYTADPTVFNSLNKKQRKVIIRLLDRIAVSNENDAIFEILDSVLDLDKNSLDLLEMQLKTTQLENIVSTIEVLRQRQSAVNKLRELMNVHFKDVLETPDLQKIIESNTWLFGHRYETIGAEEDTFTKIAKDLWDGISGIDTIEDGDVEGGATIEGAKRQTDLFLARKILTHDSFGEQKYRCIIIEIKRPGIALNKKHLRQLDDYADIIKRHPEFNSELMHFELILIGRKISSTDTEIASRMKSQIPKGEMGLVSDDDRMKRYVLNWYTLLDRFEISNDFMLKNLNLRRDSLSNWSKDELVENLQMAGG
ncbi:ATP-binding protein [Glaciimonas sp. GG7]